MSNKILVLDEKHGPRFFDASTPEKLAWSAAKVLKERAAEGGYWYHRNYETPYVFTEKEETFLNMTEEDIAGLPAVFKEEAEETRKRALGRQRTHNRYHLQEQQWFDGLNLIVNATRAEIINLTTDAVEGLSLTTKPLGMFLLEDRRDYEYETVYISELEEG